jgi:cysteinyl-tRNA synthetase
MALQVYNTLSRSKEEFTPLRPGVVRMYVCGPTVWGDSHLGHAKSYVSFDVIVRYFRFLGYRVLYVQNITDVGHLTDDADEGEDKVEKQSRQERVHPMQLAEGFTRSYFEDMDALGVVRPDISPRATGHIQEQVAMIQRLIEKGFAYESNGSVYFAVSAFPEYGKLSGRSVEELTAGARVVVNPEKRHPADFALWKHAEPGHIMRWSSPWGEGYPGWHIECSAMAIKYLGESFDIHGGGLENQFPHHECEIAQSESVTGQRFVRYWFHNNMVTVDGRKMGKSLGNFLTLKDAFRRWSPQAVRFFILQSHYRSTLDFSDDAVEAASRGLEKLNETVRRVRGALEAGGVAAQGEALDLEPYTAAFREAMDDDFNAPRAVAVLFDLARAVNQRLDAAGAVVPQGLDAVLDWYRKHASAVLGLELGASAERSGDDTLEAELIEALIAIRQDLRREKQWQLADTVRKRLADLGIELEDKRGETSWKRLPPARPTSRVQEPADLPARQALKPELPKNVRRVFGEDADA